MITLSPPTAHQDAAASDQQRPESDVSNDQADGANRLDPSQSLAFHSSSEVDQ